MGRTLDRVGLAGVSLVFLAGGMCCGVGMPELAARYTVYSSASLYEYPIAVGSEVEITVLSYDSFAYGITRARLTDPAYGEVTRFQPNILIRPVAAGQTRFVAELSTGEVMRADLTFAERASTAVVARGLATPTNPPVAPLVFAGTTFKVIADHRDAQMRSLLGHGLEAWAVSGGAFFDDGESDLVDEYGNDYTDPLRTRDVRAGTDPLLRVFARPDSPPLEVDVVPLGSTATLELVSSRIVPLDRNTIRLQVGQSERIGVRALAADGRFIQGAPPDIGFTATTENLGVAGTRMLPGEQAFTLYPGGYGETTLTVSFDGVTTRYLIVVE